MTAVHRHTDLVLITLNSMRVGRSCPSSTVPQQMLPCWECHPGQDHVTQNRLQCAQTQLVLLGGRGDGGWVNGAARVGQPVVNACKISNIGINFSYCLVWNDGLDFCGFCGLMEETCGDCRELFITT